MKTALHSTKRFFRPDTDSRKSVHLDWLGEHRPYAMARGFKETGDFAVKAVLSRPEHPDPYFYPIAFLYRQYLELQLKNIIDLGRQTEFAVSFEADIMRRHDLQRLWTVAKAMITRRWPAGDAAELQIVEQAVSEFSELDPYAQAFRYEKDLRGNKNLANARRIIGLKNLRRQIRKVSKLLMGCEMDFRNCVAGDYY
jgi:hypothetical protein